MPTIVNKVRSAEGLDCELCGVETTELIRSYIKGSEGKRGKRMWVCRTCDRYRNIYANYGVTVDEYRRVERSQKGHCAACGLETKKFWVDKHSGGISLLCPKCRMVVGNLDASKEKAFSVFQYIDRYH